MQAATSTMVVSTAVSEAARAYLESMHTSDKSNQHRCTDQLRPCLWQDAIHVSHCMTAVPKAKQRRQLPTKETISQFWCEKLKSLLPEIPGCISEHRQRGLQQCTNLQASVMSQDVAIGCAPDPFLAWLLLSMATGSPYTKCYPISVV